MSETWILMIPEERRQSIWTSDEFSALLVAVRKAEKQFARGLLGPTSLTKLKKMTKSSEKSKYEREESGNEDSSSKEKSKMVSKQSKGNGETHDTPDSELVILKGKLVDRTLNEERTIDEGDERHSGGKQKEKILIIENQNSQNESSNEEDTALVITNNHEIALREQAKNVIEERRSSLGALTGLFARPTEEQEILKTMTVPEDLMRILTQSIFMKLKDIRPVVEDSLDQGGLIKCMIEDGKESNIISIVLCAVLRHLRTMGQEDKSSSGVLRTAVAGFFEVADEVSDIILAGIFYSEAGDVLWAAHWMFVFMGLNRFVQFMFSLANGQSFQSAIEGLMGVKCITDTYRLIRDGAGASKGGQLLTILRFISLGIGILFESFPQMMLQVIIVLSSFSQKNTESNAGILIAQLASVTMSSASIGLSLASLLVDNALSLTIPGKEIHISAFKFVPRNNAFRQMMILLSLTVVTALHVILAVFGFGGLFSTAPAALSVSIIECLRDELWDLPHHGSTVWEIPELVGDHDANHAGHITCYRSCYQPWDKIEDWLNDKKGKLSLKFALLRS
eukprot:g2622.t1